MGKYSKQNLIVDVEYYNRSAESVKKCCNEYDNLLNSYVECLAEIHRDGIVSGKTADAVESLYIEVAGIRGNIAEIGERYAAIIHAFLADVDKADKLLFDGKNPKVFTDVEFLKAKAAASHIPSLLTFINGICLLSNLGAFGINEIISHSHKIINNTAKLNEYTIKELNKIQKNLKAIDNSYKLALKNVYSSLIFYRKILFKISEIVSPDSNHFTQKNITSLRKQINEAKKFDASVKNNPYYIRVTQKEVVNKKETGYDNVTVSNYVIPGLEQGFVPQGITYDKDHNYIIISGYYEGENEGYPSQLMILDASTGELKKTISLMKSDGSCYTGHAGGVAYLNGKLYITSDGKAFTISGEELENAAENESIRFSGKEEIHTAGSYACESNGILYTGNFHQDKKEEAGINPITVGGKEYYSYCEAYDPSTGERYYIITPDQTQGMTITEDGKYMFSTSYGRKEESEIYTYTGLKNKPVGEVNGVPVYELKGESVQKAPPMSEGMCNVDGKTYMLSESGSEKYRNGTDGKGKCNNPTDSVYIIE